MNVILKFFHIIKSAVEAFKSRLYECHTEISAYLLSQRPAFALHLFTMGYKPLLWVFTVRQVCLVPECMSVLPNLGSFTERAQEFAVVLRICKCLSQRDNVTGLKVFPHRGCL